MTTIPISEIILLISEFLLSDINIDTADLKEPALKLIHRRLAYLRQKVPIRIGLLDFIYQ